MYWSIVSFPELQHLEKADRERIVKACRSRSVIVRMVAYSIGLGFILTEMSTVIVLAFVRVWPWAIFSVFFLLWIAVLYQIQLIRIRGQLRLYLEREARRQKLPLCLNCGYNVEGLQSERCPECGAIWDHSKISNGHT